MHRLESLSAQPDNDITAYLWIRQMMIEMEEDSKEESSTADNTDTFRPSGVRWKEVVGNAQCDTIEPGV